MLVITAIIYLFVLAFSSILSPTNANGNLKLKEAGINRVQQTRGFLLPFKPFKKPTKVSNSPNKGVILNKPNLSIKNKATTTKKPSKPSLKPTPPNTEATSTFGPVLSTTSKLDDEILKTEEMNINETKTNNTKAVDEVTSNTEPSNTEPNSETNEIENKLSIQTNNETTEVIDEYAEKSPESNSTVSNLTDSVTEDLYTLTPETEYDSKVTVNYYQDTTEYYCKKGNAFYEIPGECDTYIECRKRVPTTRLCPDGLLFNPSTLWPDYPCAYPSEVQCDVEIKQVQVSNKNCENQYGIFPSPTNCSQYVVCTEGIASVMNCPPGLAFNAALSSCDWPENIPGCTPSALVGNLCVLVDDSERDYRYRYKKSCREYILCQRGNSHLLKCDFGFTFDETLQMCVDSEKVQDCEKI